jgi:ABC-type thiamin/hydroxymethylpyrimidine transport system permease subunit
LTDAVFVYSAPFKRSFFILTKEFSSTKAFYFSTRDLLIMAVLAALGGVTSTYVNTIGNATQAALGFPGATQWAAGLHTIWIVLAMGILRKTGSGTMMGILKGAVELMSGNSHGVIILLINLVAGMLVDFGFFIFRDKRSIAPYLVAGALSAGSNVIIFQLFATLPANIVAMSAILILTIVATVSGVIFSGIAPFFLVNTLVKANVVKLPEKSFHNRKVGWFILAGVLVLTALLTVYLRSSLKGSPKVTISGAVEMPYEFSLHEFSFDLVEQQMEYRGLMTEYSGYPLLEVIEFAQPSHAADTLLIEASDGYAFLISFDELINNPNILLVPQGHGKNASFDVVGPESSKAWVRNVVELTVSLSNGLSIQTPAGEIFSFDPDDWLFEMDSTQVTLPSGSQKLQGVPLWKIVEPLVKDPGQTMIHLVAEVETRTYPWLEIKNDDQLRIFTVIEESGVSFALGTMSGELFLYPLVGIEVE